ncbi:MAG: hypothetical protein ACKOC0_01775 [Cytophagales bacterium]
MKLQLWITFFVSAISLNAIAQFRDSRALPSYTLQLPPAPVVKKFPFGIREDAAQIVSYNSPTLYTLPVDSKQQFQAQWVSTISSLSFNNGKFGSYYYWDMRGNLIDTRGFIDISGKNKRGLKLVFPWR